MDMYFYLNIFIFSLGNLLAWSLVVNIFNINSFLAKTLVAVVIIVMALATFFAFITVNKKDTLWVRLSYLLSFSWLGILLNFGLVILFLWPIFQLIKLSGILISPFIFQSTLLILTLIISVKSFLNAHRIRIKKYAVFIKDLPVAWQDAKVVHISDIHLGPILRQKFFYRVIEKIKNLKPAAIFITGDLFDGSESDFSWVSKPLNDLKAPLGLYYSLGNHDFTLGADRVISLLAGEDIIVLNNRLIKKEGLQIIGLDFSPDRNFDLKREVLAYSGYSANEPSILLFHEPKDTFKSQGLGVDLQLSGHTHGGQMFPFNFLARYFYHNHSHGLFRRGDYTLSVTAGIGTWGPPMRLGTRSEIVELTLRKK